MNFRKNRRLSMESLESRQLMTGDLIAHVDSTGTLNITERSGHVGEPSYVTISEQPNGSIRVDGRNSSGGNSPINGFPYLDFRFANLNAKLGGGNDHVYFQPGVKLTDVTLNLGGPGSDTDTVDINGLSTYGNLTIDTGAGVDSIYVQNSTIGDGLGVDNLTINAGTGIDYIQVGNTTNYQTINGSLYINGGTAANEADTDRIFVDLTNVRDFLTVDSGGGNDTVNLLASTAGKDISVMAGDGSDTVTLRDCTAHDHLYMLLGNGDDVLDLENARATSLYANGGAGKDTYTHNVDGPIGSSQIVNFEGSLFQPVGPPSKSLFK
jgi:hypothetical protein